MCIYKEFFRTDIACQKRYPSSVAASFANKNTTENNDDIFPVALALYQVD